VLDMPPGTLTAFCAAGRCIRTSMPVQTGRANAEVAFIADIPGEIGRILRSADHTGN
jgi:hypothetical protein